MGYRATPHSTTNTSPAEPLFHRKIRTKIPILTTEAPAASDHDLQKRDSAAKAKMKAYVDSRRHASSHTLQIGDRVLHRQPKQHKLTTLYNAVPYSVTLIKGSMITAVRDSITQNTSFFKRFLPYFFLFIYYFFVPCEHGNEFPQIVSNVHVQYACNVWQIHGNMPCALVMLKEIQ